MKLIVGLLAGFMFINSSYAEKLMTKEEYVEIWRNEAINQMKDFKIPASITIAQGIIESGSGNSILAKQGNNHFGIKCHDWKGEKMYMDDDAKGECFRVYSKATDSYNDHSTFLTTKTRYSKLFTYDIIDYKSWAYGLKEAGYATNPKYPDMLIELIEKLNLNQLDHEVGPAERLTPSILADVNSNSTSHSVQIHSNKVKFIIAKKGDTFYKIAQEFDMGLWQLYRYNDFELRKDMLVEGDIIYLQPKRRKSKTDEKIYKITSETTLRKVSQEKAIKLESLLEYNITLTSDETLKKGEIVYLK